MPLWLIAVGAMILGIIILAVAYPQVENTVRHRDIYLQPWSVREKVRSSGTGKVLLGLSLLGMGLLMLLVEGILWSVH